MPGPATAPLSPTFGLALGEPSPFRRAIGEAAMMSEDAAVEALLAEADPGTMARQRIFESALRLVERVRRDAAESPGLDSFLATYDLSSWEGIMLMCLAEALLRIPDPATADRLIAEKIGGAAWDQHLGKSESVFVNASTWALMLTGRLVRLGADDAARPQSFLRRLVADSGEVVVRQALVQGMRIIGRQFVLGRTIEDALARAREQERKGALHSYDMLGEQALTQPDADAYFAAYAHAIEAVGRAAKGRGPVAGPGVSVKLSALHPRFVYAKRQRVLAQLALRLTELCRLARAADVGLCVDAEEADRLELSLDVFERAYVDPSLAGWEGLGIAVQAYQKRARPLIDWLADLARRHGRRCAVRLVKGAYWDSEIKRAQELGLQGYPVFTRKSNTDLSFLAAARVLLAAGDAFLPAFATHNAHTVAAVLEFAGDRRDFEFQRLHGMGEALYRALAAERPEIRCRIYAPVGGQEHLLAYLVRRLLENGSNTSFVNRIIDRQQPAAQLVADPVARVRATERKAHPGIPAPTDLFAGTRQAAGGYDLSDSGVVLQLGREMAIASANVGSWEAMPIVGGDERPPSSKAGPLREVRSPADRRRIIGRVRDAGDAEIGVALAVAAAEVWRWDARPVEARAELLDRAASLLEADLPALALLCVDEAGKTLADAIADVREAVDFCRYYAVEARTTLAGELRLPGPTGEDNRIARHGRGVFACISPWNFPVAIFIGQVAAALVAGNPVIAKPAEQTSLVAARAVRLMHAAGFPLPVLQMLPGGGDVGAQLVGDPRIAGVAFTGSLATAKSIARQLAGRPGPIPTLIAETGGLNVMVVDSSAMPEQVVGDVLTSAFRSAGQRCSALRVLCLQREVAPLIKRMLAGAMAELEVGDARFLATDIGPVIDEAAQVALESHARRLEREGRLLYRCPLPAGCRFGAFVPPTAFEIDRLDLLEEEVFGPILHIVEFEAADIESLLAAIRATGYGLTLGIHSRIEHFIRRIRAGVRVGNIYVNRSMIGAMVGVQPFGGEGLSGTGPKAGGPWYLPRFATERVITVNTAAAGGNAELLALNGGPEGGAGC